MATTPTFSRWRCTENQIGHPCFTSPGSQGCFANRRHERNRISLREIRISSGLTADVMMTSRKSTKKLIGWKNFLYKSCRELLDLSTLQINLDSGQQGGLDLDYILRDLKLPTILAPCSLNETR
jgi:hypothetical protein